MKRQCLTAAVFKFTPAFTRPSAQLIVLQRQYVHVNCDSKTRAQF